MKKVAICYMIKKMIASHKHKFIYFKATKVAGPATEMVLEKFCGPTGVVTPIDGIHQDPSLSQEDAKGHTPRNFGNLVNHATPKEVKEVIGNKIFNNYFKFMSVRNPWDRMVSSYWWDTSKKLNRKLSVDFKSYVTQFVAPPLKCQVFPPLNRLAHLKPLLTWATVDSHFIADDFIRYENLESDTARILKKFGLEMGNMKYPTAKANFRENPAHYTEYYDSETRQIIEEGYAGDIKKFGYEFNG